LTLSINRIEGKVNTAADNEASRAFMLGSSDLSRG
jgi:hypothetical protein